MSHEFHTDRKKQSFLPHTVAIIVVVIVSTVVGALYSSNLQKQDNALIANMSSLNQTEANTINVLYQGQVLAHVFQALSLLNNMNSKLDSIIASHNGMIKTIDNITSIHTPIIKNTFVHNTYCIVQQSKCHKK